MVSEVKQVPADAKNFSAKPGVIRKIGTLVPASEVSPTGSLARRTLRFVPHEAPPAPEVGLGGVGQAGTGLGEPRPIGAESFVQPIPVFVSPGEQRI